MKDKGALYLLGTGAFYVAFICFYFGVQIYYEHVEIANRNLQEKEYILKHLRYKSGVLDSLITKTKIEENQIGIQLDFFLRFKNSDTLYFVPDAAIGFWKIDSSKAATIGYMNKKNDIPFVYELIQNEKKIFGIETTLQQKESATHLGFIVFFIGLPFFGIGLFAYYALFRDWLRIKSFDRNLEYRVYAIENLNEKEVSILLVRQKEIDNKSILYFLIGTVIILIGIFIPARFLDWKHLFRGNNNNTLLETLGGLNFLMLGLLSGFVLFYELYSSRKKIEQDIHERKSALLEGVITHAYEDKKEPGYYFFNVKTQDLKFEREKLTMKYAYLIKPGKKIKLRVGINSREIVSLDFL